MSDEQPDVQVDNGIRSDAGRQARAAAGSSGRMRVWVNWILALLTVPAAAVVLIFVLGAVMSTAACSERQCPNLGPNGIGFGVLFYGAPVIAALTIVISFFTARRRWGIAVPVCALVLLGADIAIVAATVLQ